MKLFFLAILLVFVLTSCASKTATSTTETKPADAKKAAAVDKKGHTKAKPSETNEKVAEHDTTPSAVAGSIVCKSGADERTVATQKTQSGGCEVVYTKQGQTNSVANSQSGDSYCEGVVGKIKGNLEAAGFTCQGS